MNRPADPPPEPGAEAPPEPDARAPTQAPPEPPPAAGAARAKLTESDIEDGIDFGFRRVRTEEKQTLVRDVFDNVARNYDLMNDLMSGGIHRLWKEAMLDWLLPARIPAGYHLLDVAGGTGDIAFRFLKRAPEARATICDINEQMVRVGRDRAVDRAILKNIDYTVGNAEHLPLPDMMVDAYTIAFGLRNVTHRQQALNDAYRVLKPGGRFMCLEFSRVAVPMLGPLYDKFSFAVVPRIGELVARDRDSYQYLVESIRQFPPQEELADMLRAAGFARVQFRNLTGGIAALHSGWRL
ncbi:MAG: bifunctional demethylmenaquinone methyltransferase/2-methoxy-6-polyprenyl-1,4-benzoquinol methylase UbiE [Alphaproteobacteria bacterium]